MTDAPVADPTSDEDVTGSFERALTSDELRVLPAWRAQAWTILKNEAVGIDRRLADGKVDADLVKATLVAMVERKLRNPDALRGYAVDDGQTTIDQAISSGQLYVTPEELARLAPRLAGARPIAGGFYSVQLGRS